MFLLLTFGVSDMLRLPTPFVTLGFEGAFG